MSVHAQSVHFHDVRSRDSICSSLANDLRGVLFLVNGLPYMVICGDCVTKRGSYWSRSSGAANHRAGSELLALWLVTCQNPSATALDKCQGWGTRRVLFDHRRSCMLCGGRMMGVVSCRHGSQGIECAGVRANLPRDITSFNCVALFLCALRNESEDRLVNPRSRVELGSSLWRQRLAF